MKTFAVVLILDGAVGQVMYWERPNGGRDFSTGMIATGWALAVDPQLQTLLRNVLHRFGVKPTQRHVSQIANKKCNPAFERRSR